MTLQRNARGKSIGWVYSPARKTWYESANHRPVKENFSNLVFDKTILGFNMHLISFSIKDKQGSTFESNNFLSKRQPYSKSIKDICVFCSSLLQLSLITDTGMNQSHTFFVLLFYPIFYKSSLCPPHRYLGYKDCALKCTHSELNTLFNVTHCNVHGPDTQTLMFLLHIVKYWAEYLHPLTSWSSLGCSLKNSIKRGKKNQNNSSLNLEGPCFCDSHRMTLQYPVPFPSHNQDETL